MRCPLCGAAVESVFRFTGARKSVTIYQHRGGKGRPCKSVRTRRPS